MNKTELLSSPKVIQQNRLLHDRGKAIEYDEFLSLLEVAKLGKKHERQFNLAVLSESFIQRINEVYGAEGLFQLVMLAMAHEREDFVHFIKSMEWILAIEEMAKRQIPEVLTYDNHDLRQSSKVAQFSTNVFQPSLSVEHHSKCNTNSMI